MAKTTNDSAKTDLNPRELRRKLGLNQQEFWSAVGVTQSGGSRYESGRNMPKPVKALLSLKYMAGIDIVDPRLADQVLVGKYLEETNPETFKQVKREAKAAAKKKS